MLVSADACVCVLALSCSTLGIMMEEFTKSADIVANLLLKSDVDWARLFDPYPFFSLFKNFLQVMAVAGHLHWVSGLQAVCRPYHCVMCAY